MYLKTYISGMDKYQPISTYIDKKKKQNFDGRD